MRIVGLIAAALVLLAGCQGDPDVLEPDPTTSPTPTAARPSASPPTASVQASEDSAEGAIAFAAHWLATSNFAAISGQTGELRQISDDSCRGCETYIQLYESVRRDGGQLEGAERTLVEASANFTKGRRAVVTAAVDIARGREKQSAEAGWVETPPSQTELIFDVRRVDEGWILRELALGEAE